MASRGWGGEFSEGEGLWEATAYDSVHLCSYVGLRSTCSVHAGVGNPRVGSVCLADESRVRLLGVGAMRAVQSSCHGPAPPTHATSRSPYPRTCRHAVAVYVAAAVRVHGTHAALDTTWESALTTAAGPTSLLV